MKMSRKSFKVDIAYCIKSNSSVIASEGHRRDVETVGKAETVRRGMRSPVITPTCCAY